MPKYEEGAISPNGKWIVQGGTWVPNPAYQPTGTETAVAQSIEHGTPIQPPAGMLESIPRGFRQGMARSMARQAAAVGQLGPIATGTGEPIRPPEQPPSYHDIESQAFGAMKGPSPETNLGGSPWYAPWKLARTAGDVAGYGPLNAVAGAPSAAGLGPKVANAMIGAMYGATGEDPKMGAAAGAGGGALLGAVPGAAKKVLEVGKGGIQAIRDLFGRVQPPIGAVSKWEASAAPATVDAVGRAIPELSYLDRPPASRGMKLDTMQTMPEGTRGVQKYDPVTGAPVGPVEPPLPKTGEIPILGAGEVSGGPPAGPPLAEPTADPGWLTSSADALLKDLYGGASGTAMAEATAKPPEVAAAAAGPPAWFRPNPAMEQAEAARRSAGQMAMQENLPRFARPSAVQPPASISRERFGTETARAKRQREQQAINDIQRLRAIMGGK